MPSLFRVIFLLIALFPLCHIDAQTSFNNSLNARLVQWLNTLFYLPPEGTLRVRKEYRQLTDQERSDFHRALLLLRQDRSVPPDKYTALSSLHHLNTASGAHGGPNFLGWHRVYLVLAENALREKVANVTIPYWDNSIDADLPDPRQSIMWSPLFMGNAQGPVVTGAFAGWTTPYGPLRRNVGSARKLMTHSDISNILNRRLLAEISNPSAPESTNLEELHNDVHVYVGEQMSRIESASYDPAFYTHHAFIDCLWEEFRQLQRRRGIDPSRDYPIFVGENSHRPLSSMGLGRLLVIDGINDIFTRRIYRCEPRPACRQNRNDCGSPYLRCNRPTGRCLPLIMNTGPVLRQANWWSPINMQVQSQIPNLQSQFPGMNLQAFDFNQQPSFFG